jgi:hypothetical protein
MVPVPRSAAARRAPLGWASWQAVALVGFALVAPAALPAGGGERRLPELRRRGSEAEPLISGGGCRLHCAPQWRAPLLARVEAGVPLRVVQQWFSPEGSRWLRVEASGQAGRRARGWLQG